MATTKSAPHATPRSVLLEGLTPRQQEAVSSDARRLLVIAGAGSGKTEVMARRVAWLVVGGAAKDSVVAFTFTERAAEEMKFRIREQIGKVTPPGDDATLGDMYVGTIHGFCLAWLRQLAPDAFHNYDVLDEAARLALVQRGFHGVLGLQGLQGALAQRSENRVGQFATIDYFLQAYDLLNEYDELDVELATSTIPARITDAGPLCPTNLSANRVATD